VELTDQKGKLCFPSSLLRSRLNAPQALSRFTVFDLILVRSGPTCVRQLADCGVNAIKIDALMEDAGGE
jgi:crotonobetainyl-CoA:carnitine CoA-transferase CaiB-like acyl-CoA transferase